MEKPNIPQKPNSGGASKPSPNSSTPGASSPGASSNSGKSDVSKTVDAGLTALSQLDKSPEPVSQTIGQVAKAVKKAKNTAENLSSNLNNMSSEGPNEEVELRKSPIPTFILASMIAMMLSVSSIFVIPVILVTSPVNTVVSMCVDIWQEQDGFLKAETKQNIVEFVTKGMDWIEEKAEKLGIWHDIVAKTQSWREKFFEWRMKKTEEKMEAAFDPDDSEWDKTYKQIREIEKDKFEDAFGLAKDLVVQKAKEDGLDERETRKACNSKDNPNDPANYYYLYCVVDAYLLNQLDDYDLDNYDPSDTKSIENCLDNAPSLASLCPFTLEIKTKEVYRNGVKMEIQYYDPTFFPYSKQSCFEALGIDSDTEWEGFAEVDYFETSEAKYEMVTLQDENVTIDMGLSIEVPDYYENIEEMIILREDPETGETYYNYIPEQIVTYANAQDFIDQMLPILQQICAENGWTCAPYMVIQMGIETGWGKSQLSSMYFNFGGQKCGDNWTGERVTMPTWEVINGVKQKVNADFRAYRTLEEGIRGYFSFYEHSSYFSDALHAKSPAEFADILVGRETKYATDPDYAKKLINSIASYGTEALCK